MQVYHEEFGEGQILASTEQFDEAGNITSADVMFEHGVEMGMSAHDLQELSNDALSSYVKAKKAAIPYKATAPGIKLAQKKMAKNEEVEGLHNVKTDSHGYDSHDTVLHKADGDHLTDHYREAPTKNVRHGQNVPSRAAQHDYHGKIGGHDINVNMSHEQHTKGDIAAAVKNAHPNVPFKVRSKVAKLIHGSIYESVNEEAEVNEALEPWMGKDLDTPAYLRKAKQKEAEDAGKGGGAAVRTAKNEEKQHIEVIDASGQKRKVPVDADKAFAAVAHYRKQPNIKSARIVSEAPEIQEAIEVETVKHPIGQRPKGPGWVLKSAGEQTGKDHNVWQRKTKRLGEAAEVCTLGKESTGKTATTVAPTKKFGKPQPTNKGEVAEELTAAQKKHIDQNKNGKIDADDFEKLRGEDDDTPPWTGSSKKVPAGHVPSKSHRQKLARSGIPESVESVTEETKNAPHNVTPASADLRNVAVENTIRQIMSQNIDLRQEAKERDFNSRNNK